MRPWLPSPVPVTVAVSQSVAVPVPVIVPVVSELRVCSSGEEGEERYVIERWRLECDNDVNSSSSLALPRDNSNGAHQHL